MSQRKPEHFKETQYGFEWGNAKMTRGFSRDGWVTMLLETDKYKAGREIQIYVTKTGKVRIHDSTGEWTPPTRAAKSARTNTPKAARPSR